MMTTLSHCLMEFWAMMMVSQKKAFLTIVNLICEIIQTDDDDDDDDEEEEVVQQVVSQATPTAAPASPISSDPQPVVVADEGVADNIDNVAANEVGTEPDAAKDPQQEALDQAATINNNINPTGEEAIVDDEEDDDDGRLNN